ncbi:MAG: T9SS type A sorting domain-containing protein, partial [Bacteroidetes bacterium]
NDSIVFYSNASGLDNISYLSGEGIDTTTSVIDVDVEVQNYLYAYPPFPMPAKNYIKTLIYWDLSLDIDKDIIEVYNIYGEKLEGRERIRIDKQNQYSGWLVWDCSDVESGIYFIKINHGTRTIYLKVMVDR